MKILLLWICLFQNDSTSKILPEIKIKGRSLETIEDHLQKSGTVSLLKRGVYAAEPFLNGMSSERSRITLDGMMIYSACTDKMDPVTSYMEVTNLQKVDIHSGNGPSTSGGMDLIRRKSQFAPSNLKTTILSGFETNNKHKSLGIQSSKSSEHFYIDGDITWRNAENYKAGNKREILYSQFSKINGGLNIGFQPAKHHAYEVSMIYDLAQNIGYPSLPMDVAKAEAFIGSFQFNKHHFHPVFLDWKTRIYHNRITHIMDDSQRPNVPIRMDMPGWSKTSGIYSSLNGVKKAHSFKGLVHFHTNYSLAEMTMKSPGEKDMFMYTWPGINTSEWSLSLDDKVYLQKHLYLNANLSLSMNQQKMMKDFEGLYIFFPEASSSQSRFLTNTTWGISYEGNPYHFQFSLSYKERAPSVSEAYGFYLFNSNDGYDYIGNPDLPKENSYSIELAQALSKPHYQLKWDNQFFHLNNYILGQVKENLSPMTLGAQGVKIYAPLDYALLYRSNASLGIPFLSEWYWDLKALFQYTYGKDYGTLPFTPPLSYSSSLSYAKNRWLMKAEMEGARSTHEIPSYSIFHTEILYKSKDWQIKLRGENLMDQYYTTFSDWNKLPRMGRNLIINVAWSF